MVFIAVSGIRAYDFKAGDLCYNIMGGTNVEVTNDPSYNTLTTVVIPESVTNGGTTYSVWGIESYAFQSSGITSVTIPNSVTYIGKHAFASCSNLTSITIPNSVAFIDYNTFDGCSSLTSVTIPNSVTSIRNAAFVGCSSLTTINIPSSVTEIGPNTFERCYELNTINIPESILVLEDNLFHGCTNLTSINIPSSVTTIKKNAFTQSGLVSVSIPNSVTEIGSNVFEDCSNLISVKLPNGIKGIGGNLFQNCTSLTSVEIPNGVEVIEPYAFAKSGIVSVNIPESVTDIQGSVFHECSNLTSVKLPENITSIQGSTFYGCSSLVSIKLPNSVSFIGMDAFKNCSNLTAIQIPDGLKTIGSGAFEGCSSLTSVKIPDGVPYIDATAFKGCSNMTTLVIGRSVETIGYETFAGCDNLVAIYCYPQTPPTAPNNNFNNVYSKALLCVSPESMEAYKAAEPWNNFTNFSKLPPYTVKATANDETYGTAVVSLPLVKEIETEVTVTAKPIEGYKFVNWTVGEEVVSENTTYSFVCRKDYDFVANFIPMKYPVTFDVDGEKQTKELDYKSEITAPEDPVKTGYTFTGWSPAFEKGALVPLNGITYTAQWKINQYTITFDTDGGSEIAPITQDYATEVTAPADPTKIGHTFKGWDKEMPKTIPAENVTLKAQWQINQYTITFDTDGGSEIDPIKQDYATKVTAPADPTKAGYTFKGWDKEIPATIPAEDITVKALWQINQYTITFDTDGGSEIAPITQDYATEVTAPADPTKIGHTFMGWDKEMPKTVPAESITLKAQWQINQYTITFDTDGGSEIEPITQDYATKVTAPADPTKTGYTFKGWDKEIPETIPAEDVAVKALWQINKYNVTFKIGDEVTTKSLDYGSEITAPEVPEKEGHTFAGWSPELDETVPAKDVTYTAVYEVNTYTLTYILDGVEVNSIEVKYGEKIENYIPEVTEGRAFEGWSDNIPETMPAHDVTIHGNTVTSIFGVTIDANETVPVYSLAGTLVMKLDANNTIDRLPSGVYIIKGKKVVIKRK